MEQPNETNEFDDLNRCHYCERYAFELNFQGIAVCEKCIDRMTEGRKWRVVRDATGQVWVTTSDAVYDFEVLGEGTFLECWELCHKDDPNYG